MPIAVAFAKKLNVIGFDLNKAKNELYKSSIDPTKEATDEAIRKTAVQFVADEVALSANNLFWCVLKKFFYKEKITNV